jgi:hypothetical protein
MTHEDDARHSEELTREDEAPAPHKSDGEGEREDELPEDGLGSFEDRVLHHTTEDEDEERAPHFPIPPAD